MWSSSFGCGRPCVLAAVPAVRVLRGSVHRQSADLFVVQAEASHPSKFHRCSSLRRCRARVVQRQCRGRDCAENCGSAAVAGH